MEAVSSLEQLTLKQLETLACAAEISRWSRLRKVDLIERLVALGIGASDLPQATRRRAELSPPFARLSTTRAVIAKLAKDEEDGLVSRVDVFANLRKSLDSGDARGTKKRDADAGAKTSVEIGKTGVFGATDKTVRNAEDGEAVRDAGGTKSAKARENVREAVSDARSILSEQTDKPLFASKGSGETFESSPKPENAEPAQLAATATNAFGVDNSVANAESNDEPTAPKPERPIEIDQAAEALKEKMRRRKTLGSPTDREDRLVLTVCDPYWLRAYWEITPRLVERVRSAMGRRWHTADPILRLFKIDKEPSGATRRRFVADVRIRGGVDNWYLDVDDPPSAFMVELGYLSRDGQFFTLTSSAAVETPHVSMRDSFGGTSPSSSASVFSGRVDASLSGPPSFGAPSPSGAFPRAFDGNAFGGTFGASRTANLSFEERDSFVRTVAPTAPFDDDLRLDVDVELVVRGRATPGASVRVKETAVRQEPDGTFSIRFRLPERRHVYPVVATSANGIESQTVVLAIDRNTKTLEPVFKEEEN